MATSRGVVTAAATDPALSLDYVVLNNLQSSRKHVCYGIVLRGITLEEMASEFVGGEVQKVVGNIHDQSRGVSSIQ